MLNFRQIAGLLLLLIGLGGCQSGGVFRPLPNTPAPAGTISNLALAITFPSLQADPAGYLNQMIRVTGTFTPLPPDDCSHRRGPQSQWALIGDNLRMDMVGFEEILKLLPADTLMTVDGYWQQYRGPLGCGKEPPIGTAWYLHVTRLVQPNPLPAFELADNGNPIVFATLPVVIGDLPSPTATPQPTTTNGTLPVPPLASDTPAPTATPIAGTPISPPIATSTLPAGVTPPTNTPTTLPGPTPPAPTATLSLTQSPTPTTTPTTTLPPNPQPSATPPPPGPTSSPPPYPSPIPTGYP